MAGTPAAATEPVQGQGVQPAGGATATASSAAPAPWYGELKDADLKGWADLKALKSPEDAIKYARDTEKFVGVPKDELLRLPKDLSAAKPEELDALYTRLGRPAAPTDYKLPVVEGGEEFAGAMAPVLHAAGLSQAQATKIAEGYTAFMNKAVEAQNAAQAQQEQVEVAQLHREWPGETFNQRQEMARRAVSQFVMPTVGGDRAKAEEVLGKIEDAVGTATFLKLFSGIGEKVGEGSFVGGDKPSQGFGMTPAQADAALKEKTGDREWRTRYLNNPKGPEAQEFDRLSRIATGSAPR
jgi:hypothetical protein